MISLHQPGWWPEAGNNEWMPSLPPQSVVPADGCEPIDHRPAAAWGTVGGPDFRLCKAPLILHPATYMQRLSFFLHVFGPDKTLRAIRR